MPGCGVHLVLAARVLGTGPGSARAADRAAFFAGATGPDMGYFPGGDRFASDLAHYIRSGRLVRALFHAADDTTATAFARGWATHVLADVLIHPLINRAVAERMGVPGADALTFADNPAGHIRVEQGADAVLSARFGASALWPSGSSGFAPSVVRVLEAAYRETYHFAPSEERLEASGRAVARGVPCLLRYGRFTARAFSGRGMSTAAFAAARLATVLVPRRPAYAFARPWPPPEWLIAEMVKVMDDFPAKFTALEAGGFADLSDYNLDTGEPEDAPYPPAVVTRDQLGTRSAP